MQIGRGFRHELKSKNLVVSIKTNGSAEYDVSCFGLDSNEKLSDDRYMIFYNQMASPNNEIVMESKAGSTDFRIDLSRLPNNISKLVFTVNTDDSSNQPMSTLNNLEVILTDNMGEGFELNLSGSEFKEEKALIACEVYKYKEAWKFNMVARGFNGGLSVLLKNFGGEEEASTSQIVETAVKKVSLEKKLEDKAPALISLVKPIKVCLDKHKLNEVEKKKFPSAQFLKAQRTLFLFRVTEWHLPRRSHLSNSSRISLKRTAPMSAMQFTLLPAVCPDT